jgi:Uma2 family endonuclease
MSVASTSPEQAGPRPEGANGARPVHRFTVEQYEGMAAAGLLTADDRVELLEGVIVDKMTQNPPHNATIDFVRDALEPLLPEGWRLREQKAVRASDTSAPEPDLAVVAGPAARYLKRHPGPRDVALVVEVSDASLPDDRGRKQRIYARARIPVYWIVNLVDGAVEVHTDPRAGKTPTYRGRQEYRPGEKVPVVIDGATVGDVAVADLLPQFG